MVSDTSSSGDSEISHSGLERTVLLCVDSPFTDVCNMLGAFLVGYLTVTGLIGYSTLEACKYIGTAQSDIHNGEGPSFIVKARS